MNDKQREQAGMKLKPFKPTRTQLEMMNSTKLLHLVTLHCNSIPRFPSWVNYSYEIMDDIKGDDV